MEYEFPLEFPKCPNCGCEQTITRLAVEKTSPPEELEKAGFISFRKTFVPIQNPKKAVLSMKLMLVHEDACAGCGFVHVTRVDIQDAPITFRQQGPGQQPPGAFGQQMPPFFGRG